MKKTKKILLAEDDKFIARAYTDGLTRAGFAVITAVDGEEAMAKIRIQKPDLMLLDLIMPVKNGFEVLEELSEDKKIAKFPIIILSNLGQESDIQKAKDYEATDYLIKSNVTLKEVISRVKAALGEK